MKKLVLAVIWVVLAALGALVAHFALEWHEGTLGHGHTSLSREYERGTYDH